MSRVAWLDCSAGAAGDMLLGAALDLGLPLEALRAELATLALPGWRLEAREVKRAGLRATQAEVLVEAREHAHRGLAAILELLDRGGLRPAVRDRSAALFRRLAEAEAAAHGVAIEAVHFHELGAVDSIVDVVGGVIALDWLSAERIVASPLNLGGGSVRTAHGVLPVPAPATAELVRGVPVYGEGDGERLTPTGALLVTGHATGYGPLPPMRPAAIGLGAGSRDTAERANVLRIVVGEALDAGAAERVVVLEAQIDDQPPQLLGPLIERLLGAGALDAYFTAVQMKKGRPGVLVTALVAPERREAVEALLFAETTTLGVRRSEWQRSVLEREVVPVETAYGTVGVKLGRRGGRVLNAQPEFDDCERAAAAAGVPIKEVWAAALAAWRAREREP